MSQNVAPSEKLTPEQAQAIAALLSYPTIEKAATSIGVSRQQLGRWMKEDAAFQAALDQAESAMIEQVVRRLTTAADLALDTLEAVLRNKRAAPGVRVRAASVVLDQLTRLRQLNEIEQRLRALEESANVHNQ